VTTGKKLLYAVFGLVGLVLLLLILATAIGAFLPREKTFSLSVHLSQPRETVWQLITDCEQQPSWRPDLKSCQRLPDRGGRPTWRVTDQHDISMLMQVVLADPPARLVQSYVDQPGPAVAEWRFDIEPAATGCRLTLTERAAFPNPFFRFVGQVVLGDRFAHDFLIHLARKSGDAPDIQKAH